MKILQIIQRPQLRGAEIFACQLSVELKQLGHKVDFIYLFEHINFDLNYDLNFIPLNADQNKRFWDFGAYKRLSKIVNDGRYDMVQANAGDTLKYAAISKKLYNWKTPLIFRNANKMSAFIRSSFHKKLNLFFLKEANYIISVSESCREDIINLFPQTAEISTTATIGTFNFEQINRAQRQEKAPVWVNVSSFVPEKNHAFLINIFAAYYKKNQNGYLFLIGDGRLRSQLELQVRELELTARVKFLGYRSDVISLIKAADIMVMPSKIEGLPGVILEALSCGKPVVASDVGGIPEVVQDDFNGYCIEGYEVQEYLNKIEIVLEDSDLYKEMSNNAKQLIQDQYLMPKIAKQFEGIYEEVVLGFKSQALSLES